MKITLQDLNQSALLLIAADLADNPDDVVFVSSYEDRLAQLLSVIQGGMTSGRLTKAVIDGAARDIDEESLYRIAELTKELPTLEINKNLYEGRPLRKLLVLLSDAKRFQYREALEKNFGSALPVAKKIFIGIQCISTTLTLLSTLGISLPGVNNSSDFLNESVANGTKPEISGGNCRQGVAEKRGETTRGNANPDKNDDAYDGVDK